MPDHVVDGFGLLYLNTDVNYHDRVAASESGDTMDRDSIRDSVQLRLRIRLGWMSVALRARDCPA